jgi:lysine 2,3-aminomutase
MDQDPFQEKKYEVAPGLIYKYKGRALWLISTVCAAYCDFCMRGRLTNVKDKKPFLKDEKIDKVFDYLNNQKEIREIILSGGDPLFVPEKYFNKIIKGLVKLQKNNQLDLIRIHTRLPVVNPSEIKNWHYQILSKIKNPYIVFHINHPDEITKELIVISDNLRKKSSALLLSQSVLLKGVNDDKKILLELFSKLTINGIRPYYLHYLDPVPWAEKYKVPFEKAVSIWQSLRSDLSGVAATAKFVIEAPGGKGKIVAPEAGWKTDYSHYYDFSGKKFQP